MSSCGDQDRGPQPRLLLDPALDLPGVHRLRQRHAEIQIALAAGIPAQRNQHAELDAVGIEMLLPHQRQARARRPALLRIGIDAGRIRRHARMGQRLGKGVAQMAAIDRQMLDPLLGEIRMHLGPGIHRRMDVAIDDPQLASRGRARSSSSDAHARYLHGADRPSPGADRSPAHCRTGSSGAAHLGKPGWQHLVAVELPVRIVGREQKQLVGFRDARSGA